MIENLVQSEVVAVPMWGRNDHYTYFGDSESVHLPGMDVIAEKVVFIPNGWWVSDDDREAIVDVIRAFYN